MWSLALDLMLQLLGYSFTTEAVSKTHTMHRNTLFFFSFFFCSTCLSCSFVKYKYKTKLQFLQLYSYQQFWSL